LLRGFLPAARGDDDDVTPALGLILILWRAGTDRCRIGVRIIRGYGGPCRSLLNGWRFGCLGDAGQDKS